ncbi:hypothetical protein L218DRAFT_1001798 [Marasmius fiardii PR-910]|nr:hypothetical protein L218DRAFT_1001798 [Marasmius fiardii PR-910]
MLHFPSSSQYLPRRTDSLNATQQRASSKTTNGESFLLKIEEDLHDARRVEQHGQEDDLRMALGMVIKRVTELTTLLTEALKTQADLEVQLNVAKSNLKLVISNNEMLEEALKASSHNPKDVGWRRGSQTSLPSHTPSPAPSPASPAPSSPESPRNPPPPSTPLSPSVPPAENRFFKFRFSSSSTNLSNSGGTSPHPHPHPHTHGHPHSPYTNNHHTHLSSSSMSSLHSSSSHHTQIDDLESKLESLQKQLSSLQSDLSKTQSTLSQETALKKSAILAKTQLEEELESLTQSLFEEANQMVKTERIKRAETEEELKEVREQKEALKKALGVVEREVVGLRSRGSSVTNSPEMDNRTPRPSIVEANVGGEVEDVFVRGVDVVRRRRERSDSEVGVKSRPTSPVGEEVDDPVHVRTLDGDCGELEDPDKTISVDGHVGVEVVPPTPSTASSFTATPGSTPHFSDMRFPSLSTDAVVVAVSSSSSLPQVPPDITAVGVTADASSSNSSSSLSLRNPPFGPEDLEMEVEPSPWADVGVDEARKGKVSHPESSTWSVSSSASI